VSKKKKKKNMNEQRPTPNKKGITRKYHTLITILHKVADAILGMAGGVESLDRNPLADFKRLTMLGSHCHGCAILSPDNREFTELFKLFLLVYFLIPINR